MLLQLSKVLHVAVTGKRVAMQVDLTSVPQPPVWPDLLVTKSSVQLLQCRLRQVSDSIELKVKIPELSEAFQGEVDVSQLVI